VESNHSSVKGSKSTIAIPDDIRGCPHEEKQALWGWLL